MDEQFLITLAVVCGFVAILVAVQVLGSRAERRRTEGMKAVADELGFEFQATPPAALIDDVRTIYLFSQGRAPALKNMMWGTTRDLGVAVFDYSYTIGSGKGQRTQTQTVVRFLADGLDLPAFALRPESFWHKVGQLFGLSDIDFDTHPQFSKQYLLNGRDEAAVRGAFTADVLDYFESAPGLCVEACGPRIVVYRAGVRVEPDAVRSLLETGFDVYGAFRPAAA